MAGLLNKAESYCKTLPKWKAGTEEYEMTLEMWIDDRIDEVANQREIAKFEAKKQKYMLNHLLLGNPANPMAFKKLKLNVPFSNIKWDQPQNITTIQNMVNKLLANKKEGEVILNTNLPSAINTGSKSVASVNGWKKTDEKGKKFTRADKTVSQHETNSPYHPKNKLVQESYTRMSYQQLAGAYGAGFVGKNKETLIKELQERIN